jgi:hypothetical protein
MFEDAIGRLLREAGSAFDPRVTAALHASAFRVRDIVLDRAVIEAPEQEDLGLYSADAGGPLAEWT